MRHLTSTLLSTLFASALLGMSGTASAGTDMSNERAMATTPAYSPDLRDSVYQLARDHDAQRREARAMGSAGQAGRAGPETVPMGKTQAANVGDIRFSIYDQSQSPSW